MSEHYDMLILSMTRHGHVGAIHFLGAMMVSNDQENSTGILQWAKAMRVHEAPHLRHDRRRISTE
jgi:hypothetical protein